VSACSFADELGNPILLRAPLDAGVRVIAAHCASEGGACICSHEAHELDQLADEKGDDASDSDEDAEERAPKRSKAQHNHAAAAGSHSAAGASSSAAAAAASKPSWFGRFFGRRSSIAPSSSNGATAAPTASSIAGNSRKRKSTGPSSHSHHSPSAAATPCHLSAIHASAPHRAAGHASTEKAASVRLSNFELFIKLMVQPHSFSRSAELSGHVDPLLTLSASVSAAAVSLRTVLNTTAFCSVIFLLCVHIVVSACWKRCSTDRICITDSSMEATIRTPNTARIQAHVAAQNSGLQSSLRASLCPLLSFFSQCSGCVRGDLDESAPSQRLHHCGRRTTPQRVLPTQSAPVRFLPQTVSLLLQNARDADRHCPPKLNCMYLCLAFLCFSCLRSSQGKAFSDCIFIRPMLFKGSPRMHEREEEDAKIAAAAVAAKRRSVSRSRQSSPHCSPSKRASAVAELDASMFSLSASPSPVAPMVDEPSPAEEALLSASPDSSPPVSHRRASANRSKRVQVSDEDEDDEADNEGGEHKEQPIVPSSPRIEPLVEGEVDDIDLLSSVSPPPLVQEPEEDENADDGNEEAGGSSSEDEQQGQEQKDSAEETPSSPMLDTLSPPPPPAVRSGAKQRRGAKPLKTAPEVIELASD
jgi:hypothetical protein